MPVERAVAAFLGLALGDAYGRSLEFLQLPEVRQAPVILRSGTFRWTDDTHMSIYLARAVLDLPAGRRLDADAFGQAVGARFVEWADDPLTPSTAPGNTCLRGARAFRKHGDWQRSGDRGSDGCGAVMRILPVALAFEGAELVDAARISSLVTHAHPNAVEAAIAGAWLCRRAVQEGRLDAALVAEAIRRLREEWAWGGDVAESLEAALVLARRPAEGWLDEEAIPPGDGGWRSGSALGLAVAAALQFGGQGFGVAIDKATRIEGDSDSVGALAGMLLGAAHGTRVLPPDWLEILPDREELEGLARALAERGGLLRAAPVTVVQATLDEDGQDEDGQDEDGQGEGRQDEGGRRDDPEEPATAADEDEAQPTWDEMKPNAAPAAVPELEPLRVAWLDMGELGARAPRGRIGFCRAPGQTSGAPSRHRLGADLDRLVALHEVDHALLVLDAGERAGLGIAELVVEAEARRLVVHPCPLPPGGRPHPRAEQEALNFLLSVARAGRRVVVISRDAEERAGLFATACLIALGLPPDRALRAARALLGPRAASSPEQRAWLAERAASRP